MNSVIFHIDVNSAFLSWTSVELLKNNYKIDIRKIPSAIGGSEAYRRGVILAKSEGAKSFSVETGESIFTALKKCPELKIFEPNFKLYRSMSNKFFNILIKYTNLVERYSIDECFLDLTEYVKKNNISPLNLAMEIKERIKKELGFTVNVGISSNKILAKMASELHKPDKITTIYKHEIKEKLWNLPVGNLFMVGKSSVKKLNNLNIFTIGDLAKADITLLEMHLKKHGKLIHNYANGIDNDKVEINNYEAKSISSSLTLSYDIDNFEDVIPVLKDLVADVMKRLNKANKYADTVSVTIRRNDFYTYSHQRKLKSLTNSKEYVEEEIIKLFLEIWDKSPIRLLGVTLNGIQDKTLEQLSLFDFM